MWFGPLMPNDEPKTPRGVIYDILCAIADWQHVGERARVKGLPKPDPFGGLVLVESQTLELASTQDMLRHVLRTLSRDARALTKAVREVGAELRALREEAGKAPELPLRYLNVEQVARYLQLSMGKVYRMVHDKEIPFVRPDGTSLRFDLHKIDAWMEARGVRAVL